MFIKNINQKEENISIEYFKLISDSKKTLKQLIDDFINENNTTNYVSIGMQFISIFVKYFIILETLYQLKYDIINTKALFNIEKNYILLIDIHTINKLFDSLVIN